MAAHKFAYRWRVFTVDADFDPPKIIKVGKMDLRNMDENGILDEGDYEEFSQKNPPGPSVHYKIRGQANQVGQIMSLVLSNKKRQEHWEGFKIYEFGNKLKVGGSRLTPETTKGRRKGLSKKQEPRLAAQDEEPWLITKP